MLQTDYGPLKALTASGMLKPHSRKCRCSICRDESPKTTPEKMRKKKGSTLSDDEAENEENDFDEKEKEEPEAEEGEEQQEEEVSRQQFWVNFVKKFWHLNWVSIAKIWHLKSTFGRFKFHFLSF